MICYVTAFLDLNRDDWSYFSRSKQSYIDSFYKLAELFDKEEKNKLIVYCDDTIKLNSYKNVTVIYINREWLRNNTIWSRIDREKEICYNNEFIALTEKVRTFPEINNYEYTMINHCKIDFIYNSFSPEFDYYCWVDFGYVSKGSIIALLDIEKMVVDKINYCVVNQPCYNKSAHFHLIVAPEIICGSWFFGRKDKLLEYRCLYHIIHSKFQSANIIDDDQHLALQCWYSQPNLFALHELGEWHRTFDYLSTYRSKVTDIDHILSLVKIVVIRGINLWLTELLLKKSDCHVYYISLTSNIDLERLHFKYGQRLIRIEKNIFVDGVDLYFGYDNKTSFLKTVKYILG